MVLEKQVIQQIFGSLMKQPVLLAEVDKYSLTPSDFTTPFEKYLFAAIANLAHNGAKRITVVDIDNLFAEQTQRKVIFDEKNGIEYLQDAEDLSEPNNFEYYYNKLKKYNAIKDLRQMGFNTNNIYPDGDMLDEKDYEQREKFESMSIADIFNVVRSNLAAAEESYTCAEVETGKANKRIRELVDSLAKTPEVGAPCQGEIFNTIVRGARLGKFYLCSAGSGVGKTRTMVGNACYIAYPIRYDTNARRWVNQGNCERVLYIGTEQKSDEIQTMILAYLTGINEEKILYGSYDEDEADRLEKAYHLMDMYEDNFIISRIPEPNLQEVKTHIRSQSLQYDIKYVFYDYIFATPSLLSEFRDINVRPDVALRLLSTLLKDLAAELKIFVMSATQLTGDMEFKVGTIRNQMMLRDSKSIPDKADVAMIKARVLPEELNLLSVLCSRIGKEPNQVTDVYKNRRGRLVDVRIWSYADLGTCRTEDLFITDASLKEISDFNIKYFVFDSDELEKLQPELDLLNEGVTNDEQIRRFEEQTQETSSTAWENLL